MDIQSNIVIYTSKEGTVELEVSLEKETVWLTQQQMAQLFNKNVRTISEHIQNAFKEGEIDQNSVIRKSRITAQDGKTYETLQYNLDIIISVGYRVKSLEGTQFRIWATLSKRLVAITYIPVWKKKPHICSISSSKIIPLQMAINGLVVYCSFFT